MIGGMEQLPTTTSSARLTMRLWEPDDAPALSAAVTASLEHLRPWMPWAAVAPTAEDERELIGMFADVWRAGGEAVYGVFAGDAIVGGTGLHRRAGPDTLEIGYWIHVDHIGRGYATEVSAALTDVAFTVDGIEFVEIHHDAANVRSAAVPAKLGFVHVATRPDIAAAPAEVGEDWTWRVDRDAWLRRT